MSSPPHFKADGFENGEGAPDFDNFDADETRYALIQSLKTSKGAQDFVQSMSLELLLQDECDWGTLLSHAPRALCSMGQCFVVASTPLASSIQLTGSKELKYESLRANLVHCSDLGRAAFRQAENKMGKVGMYTQYICENNGTIDKILKALENDTLAKHELPHQLERLKKFAQECVEDARAVQNEFEVWQQKAAEIRRVCVDEEHRTTTKQATLTSHRAGFAAQAEYLSGDIKQLKLETVDAKKDVEFHQEQYVQASKPFSSSWEGMAQRYLGTMIDGVTAVAESGASLLAVNFAMSHNPLLAAAAHPLTAIAGRIRSTETAPAPAPAPATEDLSDHGFDAARRIVPPLQKFLKALGDGRSIHDGVFGMDWRTLSGDDNRSMNSFATVMAGYRDDPALAKSKTQVSLEVLNIIHRVMFVVKEMDYWRQREHQAQGGGINALDAETVQKWRTSIEDALGDALALSDRRKIAEEGDVLSSKNAKAKQTKTSRISRLKQYRENYASSQKVLGDAQNRLRERTEKERRAQQQFQEIQQQLESLESETTTMADVRKILGNCTENLYEFQQELSELVRFFDSLYNFVDTTYKTQGEDFLRSAGNLNTMLDDVPAEERAAFKQARMDDMMVASLKLRGYYAVMREISGTYVEVSRKFIMPGVSQVDQLSLTDSSSVSQKQISVKIKQISDFAATAQSKINELASKRKKGLQDQLMKKQGEAEEVGYMIEQAHATAHDGESVESAWAF